MGKGLFVPRTYKRVKRWKQAIGFTMHAPGRKKGDTTFTGPVWISHNKSWRTNSNKLRVFLLPDDVDGKNKRWVVACKDREGYDWQLQVLWGDVWTNILKEGFGLDLQRATRVLEKITRVNQIHFADNSHEFSFRMREETPNYRLENMKTGEVIHGEIFSA